MVIDFTKFISAMSRATDVVESEILSIPAYHEKRVAVLVHAIGKHLNMDEDTVYALTLAGAMHDCALSEYLEDEYMLQEDQDKVGHYIKKDNAERKSADAEPYYDEYSGRDGSRARYDLVEMDMAAHCIAGEKMIRNFPFYDRVRGAVLYHHDRADGKGALKATAEETPVYAQIVHVADAADAVFGLDEIDPGKFEALRQWLNEGRGSAFTDEMADAFLAAVDYDLLASISGDGVTEVFDRIVPSVMIDVPIDVMRELSDFFAHIADYKSHFTWNHSKGVAEKAEKMARYYGLDDEMCSRMYIAGALHDIGKLLISNDIIEKRGKLTEDEFRVVQNHAMGTWQLLHDIKGLEEICSWASLHHEKLDGSGYPFGYTGDKLGKYERVMACIDIYQALTEERPYKVPMSHTETMKVLCNMSRTGKLDADIVNDLDRCFGAEQEKN